jgi:3-oxoacyl-[acyl-carrier protein] reductase
VSAGNGGTPLRGRVALVTAAGRGLGAAIARELARQGADVAVTYRRDEGAATALVAELERGGCRAAAFAADAADFARAGAVVAETRARLGGLDILVCNAGIARSAPIVRMSEEDWDVVMGVTLKGTFNYLRAAAPGMVEQRRGKVICIGSINGLRGRIGTASYNAAKAGLTGLVKTAAAELGPAQVNVNLIAPGYLETPSQTTTPELIRDLVLKETALRRLGTPADVAPVVAFLASDAAAHITGQVIKVDAGQYL